MAVPDAVLLFAVGPGLRSNPCQARCLSAGDDHGRYRSTGRKDRRAPTGSFRQVSHCVSNRPIWLGEAARRPEPPCAPTIQRIAGSWRRQLSVVHVLISISRRPNTDCRSKPTNAWRFRFSPVRASARVSPAIVLAQVRRRDFAIGQQSGIGGHHRAAKLQHHPAVEIQLESLVL